MPLSAPGIILYSLEASIADKNNKNKAYKYKIPYFTDAKLLTHDQLERINNIINEKHSIVNEYKPSKDVSITDMSKYHLSETEYPSLSTIDSSKVQSKNKPKNNSDKFKPYIPSQVQSNEIKNVDAQINKAPKQKTKDDYIKELEDEWNKDIADSNKIDSNVGAQKIVEVQENKVKKMSKSSKLNKYKHSH